MLSKIQKELKAPKGQTNSFGKYKYRSCEDILEAVKPLLPEGTSIILTDKIVEVGGRIYVKATALLTNDQNIWEADGWAREAVTKKGMDDAQITGSASSYARKYALNGLFAIDDTKDADTDELKTQSDNAPKGKKPMPTGGTVWNLGLNKYLQKKATLEYIRANYEFDEKAFLEDANVQN